MNQERLQTTASTALALKRQIDSLSLELEEQKEILRGVAGGEALEVTVEGVGQVRVTKPREGSTTLVTVFNEAILETIPDLKVKLIDKGVLKEEEKVVPAARASVYLDLNV